MATAAKSGVTTKAKPRGRPWQKGQSGNPAGAPKRGQSWAELIKELGDLDGPQAAARAQFLAKQFRSLEPGVTLKELVVLRVYSSLIDDPQPGLLNSIMDRAEGKVTQPTDNVHHFETVEAYDYGAAIAAIASRPDPDSTAPGEGEGDRMRPPLGQDPNGG